MVFFLFYWVILTTYWYIKKSFSAKNDPKKTNQNPPSTHCAIDKKLHHTLSLVCLKNGHKTYKSYYTNMYGLFCYRISIATSNYCKCIIISMYDICRFLDFLLFMVKLICWVICIHLFKP